VGSEMFIRDRGAIAPGHDDALTRVGTALDAAMFAPEPPDRAERDEVDVLLVSIETEWSTAANPGDLVPSR
jgi:hypothetical protein